MAGKPTTLTSAIGLARLCEARNIAIRKNSLPEARRQPLGNRTTVAPPTMPIKRLTPAKLKEHQENGLCYKCNDKYGLGHRCKKLFMIEAYWGKDRDGDVVMEEDDGEEGDQPLVSLHAITGKDAPETMKVYGVINKIISLVLIDFGSTHNFMSLALAHLLGMHIP
jgi:hypothetical protein